ncbi:MAG: hypothetical protein ACLFVU_11630 [Phycisphaerae bacterium]
MSFARRLRFLLVLCCVAAAAERLTAATGQRLTLEATLIRKSETITAEDIAPYRKALICYEYRVEKVLRGTCDAKTVRVFHWAVRAGKPLPMLSARKGSRVRLKVEPCSAHKHLQTEKRSDTLAGDTDTPLFYDIGQTEKIRRRREKQIRRALGRGKRSFDYGCGLSEKIRGFLVCRKQLRLVGVGDSRTQQGFKPSLMYERADTDRPPAYNLAVESTSLFFQDRLIREYLLTCPKLEWVVYGVSPRVLNEQWTNRGKLHNLLRSPGYRYDRKHRKELETLDGLEAVTADELRALKLNGRYVSPCGWNNNKRKQRERRADKSVAQHFQRCRFDLSVRRLILLRTLARDLHRRGVRLMIFTPPIHPGSALSPAVDDDGTSREGNQLLVRNLNQLAREFANVEFVDINRGGRHELGRESFADGDHCNETGADKLTRQLEQVRVRAERKKLPQPPEAPEPTGSGCRLDPARDSLGQTFQWQTLKKGLPRYTDRNYIYSSVPEALADLPVLQPANDTKKQITDEYALRFTLPCRSRVWLLLPEDTDAPQWLSSWFAAEADFGKTASFVCSRVFDKGSVTLGRPQKNGMYTVIVQPLE